MCLYYNVSVSALQSRNKREHGLSSHPKRHIYDVEATGLIVVAILIMILILVRFWHNIPWGVR
ncbi:MAG TPA: hypothetical protein VH437_18660 [Terriglobales bacterium]|jgi:hypothetical protein